MNKEAQELQEYIDTIATTAKLIGYGVLQTNSALYVYQTNPQSDIKTTILELTFQHQPLILTIHFKGEESCIDDRYSQLIKVRLLKRILELI